jgi:chitosanase
VRKQRWLLAVGGVVTLGIVIALLVATTGAGKTAKSPAALDSPTDGVVASSPDDSPYPDGPSPSAGQSASVKPSTSASVPVPAGPHADLTDPRKKEIAMELVSSAENSSLNWKAQYKYIEDIHDGRGYTGGIIGFCSGTSDMLALVQLYAQRKPGNILAKYLPALKKVNGSSSHSGLDPTYVNDWKTAAADPVFQQAQNDERDSTYFNPAVRQAKADGLPALGQFIYYDAIVMHGPGSDPTSFGGIRASAMRHAKTPAQGGDLVTYLNAFLDARVAAMKTEAAHDDTSRVDTEQRVFVQQRNLDLTPPLRWKVYGDPYQILR